MLKVKYLNYPINAFLFGVLLLAVLLPWHQQSAADSDPGPLTLSDTSEHIHLTEQLKVLKDSDGEHGIADLSTEPGAWNFLPNENGDINDGYTSAVYWLKIDLVNNAPQLNWLLEIASPSLDEVTLYEADGKGGYSETVIEHTQPMEERPFFHHNLVFPLQLESEETTLYIRAVTDGAMQLPVHIWEERAFVQNTRMVTALIGVLAGASAIFIAFLLYRGIYYRRPLYLVLAALTLSLLMTLASMAGLTFAYVWQDLPRWNHYAILLFIGLSSFFLFLFNEQALDLKRELPTMARLIYAAVAGQLGFLVVLYFSFTAARILLPTFLLISAAMCLAAALVLQRKGNIEAPYFAFGSLLLLSGISIVYLITLGFLPPLAWLRLLSFPLMAGGLLSYVLALYAKEREGKRNEQIQAELEERRHQAIVESLQRAVRQKDELLEMAAASLKSPLHRSTADNARQEEVRAPRPDENNLPETAYGISGPAAFMQQKKVKGTDRAVVEMNLYHLAEVMAKERHLLNVLVAGRSGLNRETLVHQLQQQSYAVQTSSDGAGVIAEVFAKPPDLLIIESGLEDMKTVELCRKIRGSFSMTELPILLLSEREEVWAKKAAFRAGINDYLVTPCEKEEFLLRVSTLTNLSGLTTEIVKMNHVLEKNIQEQSMALAISNQNLFTLTDEIQEIERIRNEMLSVISHELNTPITLIHHYIQAVQENVIEEKNPQYLSMIHNKLMVLERLTEDLVDLAKYRSGNMTLRFNEMNAGVWLRRMMDSLVQDGEKSGRTMNSKEFVQWKDAEGFILIADVERLDQVFSNILWNAVKHTDPDDGDITLSVSIESEELAGESPGDARLHIRITDTGPGIPPDVLPFIFERFYKVEKNTEQKGSGLGLAIAKEIVTAHKGEIWAESKVGKGSTFHVALPLTQTDSAGRDAE